MGSQTGLVAYGGLAVVGVRSWRTVLLGLAVVLLATTAPCGSSGDADGGA